MSLRKSLLQLEAVPFLILCIGYLSIFPLGATYIEMHMPSSSCMRTVFSPIELLPLIGFALMAGYSQAARGQHPWRVPRLFWATSFLFNVAIPIFMLSEIALSDFPKILAAPFENLSQTFHPYFDPEIALEAASAFLLHFILFAMPLVAILSAIEAIHAFREAKTTLPENRIPPWS